MNTITRIAAAVCLASSISFAGCCKPTTDGGIIHKKTSAQTEVYYLEIQTQCGSKTISVAKEVYNSYQTGDVYKEAQ